jgi:hypothetical protein
VKNPPTHVIATLKLPTVVALLLALAKAIVDAITTNKATFPSPTPPLATVSADIDALDTAETATKTKTLGTVQVRDAKRKTLVSDLHQLQAYVQQIANQNPDNAESIVVSAGMGVRQSSARAKPDIAVKALTSGSVQLSAKALPGNRAHEWQYSTDGKTWVAAPPTTKASTVITGLQSGVITYFRHRSIATTGTGDWTAPVSIAVV